MATSGTNTFNLDIIDTIEEAYELAGRDLRGGYDMRTARRSLDLLMREWGNRGINFWTINEVQVPVLSGDTTLTLAQNTIDVLDAVWRTNTGMNQNDRILTRMSVVDWSQTANKLTVGLPSQYYIARVVPPVMTIWPVPTSGGTLVYWGLRSIQDVGGYENTMDIPPRFLTAMVFGLAKYLAMKIPEGGAKLQMLTEEYERQYVLASEEDRERAPFRLVPDLS